MTSLTRILTKHVRYLLDPYGCKVKFWAPDNLAPNKWRIYASLPEGGDLYLRGYNGSFTWEGSIDAIKNSGALYESKVLSKVIADADNLRAALLAVQIKHEVHLGVHQCDLVSDAMQQLPIMHGQMVGLDKIVEAIVTGTYNAVLHNNMKAAKHHLDKIKVHGEMYSMGPMKMQGVVPKELVKEWAIGSLLKYDPSMMFPQNSPEAHTDYLSAIPGMLKALKLARTKSPEVRAATVRTICTMRQQLKGSQA